MDRAILAVSAGCACTRGNLHQASRMFWLQRVRHLLNHWTIRSCAGASARSQPNTCQGGKVGVRTVIAVGAIYAILACRASVALVALGACNTRTTVNAGCTLPVRVQQGRDEAWVKSAASREAQRSNAHRRHRPGRQHRRRRRGRPCRGDPWGPWGLHANLGG